MPSDDIIPHLHGRSIYNLQHQLANYSFFFLFYLSNASNEEVSTSSRNKLSQKKTTILWSQQMRKQIHKSFAYHRLCCSENISNKAF